MIKEDCKLKELAKAHNGLDELFNELHGRVIGLEQKVAALTSQLEQLSTKGDRRGPKSQKEMTDDDARRLLFGDLQNEKHKEAAELLGYSYAQVYSMRNRFTFKHIHKEHEALKKAAAELEKKNQGN